MQKITPIIFPFDSEEKELIELELTNLRKFVKRQRLYGLLLFILEMVYLFFTGFTLINFLSLSIFTFLIYFFVFEHSSELNKFDKDFSNEVKHKINGRIQRISWLTGKIQLDSGPSFSKSDFIEIKQIKINELVEVNYLPLSKFVLNVKIISKLNPTYTYE